MKPTNPIAVRIPSRTEHAIRAVRGRIPELDRSRHGSVASGITLLIDRGAP